MNANFNDEFGPKRLEVIIIGKQISPERAIEIIRRTDGGFSKQLFPVTEYGRTVRSMLGYPNVPDTSSGARYPTEAVAHWRAQWGAIDHEWLGNNQLLYSKGWCHADGTLAWVDELEDYPRACHILEDCQTLAATFPDLVMNVAAWGTDQTILGAPIFDAPESPWPQELLDGQSIPSFGFMIGDGKVAVVEGANPWLFDCFGLNCSEAVEKALGEVRRCARQAVRETAFGDRGLYAGLPDNVIHDWCALARSMELVS